MPNVLYANAETIHPLAMQPGPATAKRQPGTEKQRGDCLSAKYKDQFGPFGIPNTKQSQMEFLDHLLKSGVLTHEEVGKILNSNGVIYRPVCGWLISKLSEAGKLDSQFQKYSSRPRRLDVQSDILRRSKEELAVLLRDPKTKDDFIRLCCDRAKNPAKASTTATNLFESTGIHVHRETGMRPLLILKTSNSSCDASSPLEECFDDFDPFALVPPPADEIWRRDVIDSYRDDIRRPWDDMDQQFFQKVVSYIVNG